ncbi:molybdopterin molybdotransferase MoeA [Aquibium sp. A9E412]|uniref:molybdopterin molybdotransferase MoeA n=1 Tax=Aquibium sp. A9E412 TaxID=2976767 RepID=UPI0025AF75CE|nr:gephyrin-like molybdotransferase Glp [Aquibium sp. A9E412]MDN2564694.1 molybdopterin molybdotransferase MoeA [Aquibium sp. A9E412]
MALLPVDEALSRLLAGAAPLAAETVPLDAAAGRVLAASLAARRTQPPFDASAMDGYAVRAADVAEAGARLRVVGRSVAGARFAGTLDAGAAVRIFTGAPVPGGADTILLQEDAESAGDGTIVAREAVAAGRHIRRAGLDFQAGDTLLEAGRLLDPAALSLAAAANHARLSVVRRPLVAVLATGDELVAPGGAPGPDQIVASNGVGIAALARADGATVMDLGIVGDSDAAIAAAAGRARAAGADILVTLGGASVGEHDLVQGALAGIGMTLDFWKIAMRPGKPLMVGRLGASHVLGLPGNPVSSLVCAHLFLRPLIARLAGRTHRPDLRPAVLGAAMRANDRRRDYVRARVDTVDGRLTATPFATQDSSMLTTLAAADGLVVREPFAAAAAAGEACRVLMLR